MLKKIEDKSSPVPANCQDEGTGVPKQHQFKEMSR